MTPEEFDALEEYDENYRYELVHGVLVVTPIPLAEETGPMSCWDTSCSTIGSFIRRDQRSITRCLSSM